MDLSGLLEKLKSLFTPSFLISSVTPLFCFILFNGAIFGQYNHTVRKWVSDYYVSSAGSKTVTAAIISIVLLVIAYVFSTLNLFLLEILQGQHLPKWLEYRLRTGENARLDAVTQRWKQIRGVRRNLTARVKVKVEPAKADPEPAKPNVEQVKPDSVPDQYIVLPVSDNWIETLHKSYKEGNEIKTCRYPSKHAAHQSLQGLLQMRDKGAVITADDLKNSVDQLSRELATNSATLPDNADSIRLDRDAGLLEALIAYALGKSEDKYIRQFNEKEFDFSRYTVAPTRMGNVAESVRSYALSRYGMNLDFFWPRLQKVLQNKSGFYQTLQDAKTQLDFIVSLFWLTLVSTALWLALLPFLSRTWLPLISVWMFGPLIAIMWYRMAVQNYRSFAGLLRSCIDLFRFELLTDLKIPLPQDSQVEQQTWDRLNHWISYGEKALVGYKTD